MRLVTRLLLRLGVGGLSLAATAGAASTPEPWADIAATDLKATNIVPGIDATFYEWPGFLPAVAADVRSTESRWARSS